MKVIQSKDYNFDGVVGYWYQFSNKHYDGLDSERLLVKRAKLILEDGSFVYLDPIDKRYVNDSNRVKRLIAYYNQLNNKTTSVVEGK